MIGLVPVVGSSLSWNIEQFAVLGINRALSDGSHACKSSAVVGDIGIVVVLPAGCGKTAQSGKNFGLGQPDRKSGTMVGCHTRRTRPAQQAFILPIPGRYQCRLISILLIDRSNASATLVTLPGGRADEAVATESASRDVWVPC